MLSVDHRGYETRLDEGLLRLVPPTLRVVRSPAWAPARGASFTTVHRLAATRFAVTSMPGQRRSSFSAGWNDARARTQLLRWPGASTGA